MDQSLIRNLDFTIDIYDANGNVLEPLARMANWELARVAFEMMAARYPDQNVIWRHKARTVRASL